ncbi:hypothetical protein ACMGDK_11385 [Chryseobacterium sp. DT-3]|uniref:hypothetical protein n=1 Tax=Chryseobacterium sp. DT-3 TaxID=3396164 RepID=UPI003F1BCEB3
MSELVISNKPKCMSPILNGIEIISNDTVRYTWSFQNNYNNFAAVLLEISFDLGQTFISVASVPPNSSPYPASSFVFQNGPTVPAVMFRVTSTGSLCGDLHSNTIVTEYVRTSTLSGTYYISIPNYSCEATSGTPSNYEVTCKGFRSFRISELANQTLGKIRLKTNGNNSTTELTKKINNLPLIIGEELPIDYQLEIIAETDQQGNPNDYPTGQHVNYIPAMYVFEHTFDDWLNFTEFNLATMF